MRGVKNLQNSKRLLLGKAEYTKLLLALVFVAMVFIPMLRMFSYMDLDSVMRVVASPVFGDAVIHSLSSALLGTVITVVLAFILAMCVERTNIPCKSIFGIIFVLPMLIPSIWKQRYYLQIAESEWQYLWFEWNYSWFCIVCVPCGIPDAG